MKGPEAMVNWFHGRSISAWHLSAVRRMSQTQTEPRAGGPAGPGAGSHMAAGSLEVAKELLPMTTGEEREKLVLI